LVLLAWKGVRRVANFLFQFFVPFFSYTIFKQFKIIQVKKVICGNPLLGCSKFHDLSKCARYDKVGWNIYVKRCENVWRNTLKYDLMSKEIDKICQQVEKCAEAKTIQFWSRSLSKEWMKWICHLPENVPDSERYKIISFCKWNTYSLFLIEKNYFIRKHTFNSKKVRNVLRIVSLIHAFNIRYSL